MIIGPGRLGLLKKLFFLIKNNLPVPMIGSGKNRYQFISVFDCADAFEGILDGQGELNRVNSRDTQERVAQILDSDT